MSIKEHIEQTIRVLESEKEQKILAVKQKVIPEKIAPYNSEVDAVRDKAIMEKRQKAEQDIANIKERYAEEKAEIEKAAEENKKKNESAVILSETYAIQKSYDNTISKLKSHLKELEE